MITASQAKQNAEKYRKSFRKKVADEILSSVTALIERASKEGVFSIEIESFSYWPIDVIRQLQNNGFTVPSAKKKEVSTSIEPIEKYIFTISW